MNESGKLGTWRLRLPPRTHTQFVATFHSSLPHVYISFSCAIFHFVPSSTVKIRLQKKFHHSNIFLGEDLQTFRQSLDGFWCGISSREWQIFSILCEILAFSPLQDLWIRQQVVAALHFCSLILWASPETKRKKFTYYSLSQTPNTENSPRLNAVCTVHIMQPSGGEHLNGLNTFHIVFCFLCSLLLSWILLKELKECWLFWCFIISWTISDESSGERDYRDCVLSAIIRKWISSIINDGEIVLAIPNWYQNLSKS